MMIWTMATYVSHSVLTNGKLPYFLILVPHLKPNDGGGVNAIHIMMKNWSFERKPHIVADSGFGSFSLLAEITQWGGTATLSLPINECQRLNLLLGYNLPVGYWRACINSQGVIFSAQCKEIDTLSGSTGITKKFVISSAFKANSASQTVIPFSGILYF